MAKMKSQNRTRRSTVITFSMVILGVVLTTLLRLALNPLLGKKAALIMYFPALVFSAWIGGWTAGLVTLALSALAATYFFIAPTHTLSVTSHGDQLTLLIFIIVCLSVSALSNAQRKAQQQAENSAEHLRESEARKSAVLEVALDCIITVDAKGCILEFNPAAERTFGWTRAEALGRPIAETIIPPSLRDAHRRGLEHFLTTGDGPILGQRVEVIGMRKGGEEFPVEIAILPTSGNGVIEFTAYLRDIAVSKNAAALQRRFLKDVLSSVTEGRLLLCDTADELPPLLTPVGAPIPLSREGGMRELRHVALDAAEGMADERRHDLVTAVSEAGMNAVVHAGGGTGQVTMGADGTVQVRVEDHGEGITMENLPRATLSRGFSTKATLGHGLKMMIETADRLYLLTGPGGTTVILEMGIEKALPAWL